MKTKIYPTKLGSNEHARLFISDYLLKDRKLKQSAVRHIPENLITEIMEFGRLLGLNSTNKVEHILWVYNNFTTYPKQCLTCGSDITDFESFNQQYKSNFCSYSCMNSNEGVYKKKQDTHLKNYGTTLIGQGEESKKKAKQTCLTRFGAEHNMQTEEGYIKNQRHKTKQLILPSGKQISYQGYENVAILKLLENYSEQELHTQGMGIPTIWYGKSRYYPDIFIPKDNLIIEVKSTWTFQAMKEKNLLKRDACIKAGYNFQFWICSKTKILEVKT
jgi:hypothetical protein